VEGIAYEVIGAEGQGDQIIIPKGQVQEEETAEDVDVDPSSNLTPDTKAKNSPLPCVGSSLLVFMVALPFGLSKISRCRQESK
jgi:hypothetical protein